MKVEFYDKTKKNLWDDFVKNSKNSHFFFYRDFLEYHEDRFDDFSLMIYSQNKLIALLPANKKGSTLYSHQGLTFGGFILKESIKLHIMIEVVERLKEFLKTKDITELIYKPSPYIYHKKPTFEDIYALNPKSIKRDISSVIDLTQPVKYSNGRKHSIRKAKKFGFEIQESDDFESFWEILESVLKTHHDAKPLHNLEEILKLNSLFPKNIKLFLVKKDNKLYAGAIAFITDQVIKLQYVANYKKGRELGALDILIDYLIKERFKDKRYFDFGTSFDSKRELNLNLLDQKERFGASSVLQETFRWEV